MFKYFLKLTRPRFWLYVLGPYLIGSIAAFNGDFTVMFTNLQFVIGFIYFLIPANLLIYGVNDIADYDTDLINEKKSEYEVRIDKNKQNLLIGLILISNLPIVFLFHEILEIVVLLVFWFLAVFYSLNPIRAKAKPFWDSLFNFLYVIPAVLAYINFSQEGIYNFNWLLFLAAGLWCMGMHTFSAIPDITADKNVGLNTTAVKLNVKKSSMYVGAMFLISAIIGSLVWNKILIALLIPYLILVYLSYKHNSEKYTFKIYKYFPLYNALVGFIIFWLIVFKSNY